MITHRIVAYLIGMAVGYWVLTLAAKENGANKTIGKVIGWIIIVVSLCGPICIAGSALCCKSHGDAGGYSSNCPWNGHMMGGTCPGMGQEMTKDKDMMGKKGMGGEKNKSK